MDNFEQLLTEHTEHIFTNIEKHEVQRQKANKSASLMDFIEMLNRIISMKMHTKGVKFIPDEGKKLAIDPSKPIEHPYITYKIVSRIPKTEKKPRIRESISEITHDEDERRSGYVYGQKFQTIMQFDIYAADWKEAEQTLNSFEDLMLTYTYYFKQNGVGELMFHKQFTDENLSIFRETMSIRSVQYYLEIEKLTKIFYDEIESIDVK